MMLDQVCPDGIDTDEIIVTGLHVKNNSKARPVQRNIYWPTWTSVASFAKHVIKREW